jgi:hypothetical protein
VRGRYRHSQTGHLLRLAVIAPTPLLLLLGPGTNQPRVLFILVPTLLLLVIVSFLFTSMTIEIDGEDLTWFFGPGVWRKRIPLVEIASATPVTNPWWYGWGIHKTPRGWLYNVSGLEAVEVVLKSGAMFRLGTDEAPELARILAPSHARSSYS